MVSEAVAALSIRKNELFHRAVIFLTDGDNPLALFPIYMEMSQMELAQLNDQNNLHPGTKATDFRKIMFLDEDGNHQYQWLMNDFVGGLELAEEDEYQEVMQSLLDQNAISMDSILNIGLDEFDDDV